MRRQRGAGVCGKAAAEIRAHQILLLVINGAGDVKYGHAEATKIGAQARKIERRMHGVARAGMRQSKSSSNGPVASEAPARLSPMRAAVCRRSSAHKSAAFAEQDRAAWWAGLRSWR